jgi:hypothetical protein
MKYLVLGLLIAFGGCSMTDPQRPMPGSLTYGGKVVYSHYKPGTIVKNTFLDQFGYRVFERYQVQPDGTLKLTYQVTGPDFLWD